MHIPPMNLDLAATTPVALEAISAMHEYLGKESCYYNPSSTEHLPGQNAANAIHNFRQSTAYILGCETDEIIFTSGATESNNLALRGIAKAHSNQGKHLITSQIEHKSILATCQTLEQEGFQVTYLKPNTTGLITPESIKNALQPDTLLVSIQQINNETGVIQPIESIAEILLQNGVLFHVDAAQGCGKLPLNLNTTPIDLLSFSAHKFHGPKGIGGLVIRNRRQLRLQPLIRGGGQEFGLRAGTLATHQIAGMCTALQLINRTQKQDTQNIKELKHNFLKQLTQHIQLKVHGEEANCSPYIVNFSIHGINNDALINQLQNDVALSTGSACSSGTIEPSYVLRAMGIEGQQLYGAVRASFCRYHTQNDINFAAEKILAAVRRIQDQQ